MFSLDIIIMEYYQHIVRRKMYVEFRAIGTNLAGTFQRTDRVLSRALRFPIPPDGRSLSCYPLPLPFLPSSGKVAKEE